MAQRLNKKLVVGLTIAGMLLIAGAGVLLVYSLPGRDPKPVAEAGEKKLAEAEQIRTQIREIDTKLAEAKTEQEKDALRAQRKTLQTSLQDCYEAAQKYFQKAYGRALGGSDAAAASKYLIKAGDVAMSAGTPEMAAECWRIVLRNNPKNIEAQQKLVELHLQWAEIYGRDAWNQLREQAEQLVAADFDPDNVVGINALGRCMVEAPNTTIEEMEKGGKLLEKAFEADRTNPKFAESLALYPLRLLERRIAEARRQGRSEEAAAMERNRGEAVKFACEVYDRLIEAVKNLGEEQRAVVATAWRKRAQFHLALREAADSELKQKAKARATPAQLEEVRQRIDTHSQLAKESIEEALELSKNDVESLVLMGNYVRSTPTQTGDPVEQKQKEHDYWVEACEWYKKAIQADPDSFIPYLELHRFYVRQADDAFAARNETALAESTQKAAQVLEERIKRGIGGGVSQWRDKSLLGELRYQLFRATSIYAERLIDLAGSRAAAEQEIKPVLEQMERIRLDYAAEARRGQTDPVALFMKARLLMFQGKPVEAIQAFRELQPHISPPYELWVQSKMYLAQLCLQIGEPGPAVDALKEVTTAVPNLGLAWGMLAQALSALPDNDAQAEEAAKRALTISQASETAPPTGALMALARVYERQKNWKELERIQQMLGSSRSSTENDLLEASLLLARANDPEQPEPALVAQAQQKLRKILEIEPANERALRALLSTLVSDASEREEVVGLLAKANAEIDRKLAEAEKEADRNKLQLTKNKIALLGVMADPSTSPEEKLAKTEELVKSNPDPFMAAVELYRLYVSTPGRQQEAIPQLKAAYELKKDDPVVVEMLFRASISSIKDSEGKEIVKPDYALAQQMITRAKELNLDRSDGHYYQGQLYFAQQDFAAAEREFREALRVFPVHSNGYTWLGRTLLAQKRNDEAQKALEEALRLNRLNGMAAYLLAFLANDRGDAEAKKQYLELCRQLNFSNDWTRAQEQLAQDEADPVKGIARREEIRKSKPDDWGNLAMLAQLYVRTNQVDKAREVLEACHRLQPKNLNFLQDYARFLRSLNPPDYKAAEAAIRKTLESIGPDEKDLQATAELLLAAHMETLAANRVPGAPSPEEVEQAFTRVAAISQKPELLVDIANHFLRKGDYTKREEWLRKAIAAAHAKKDAVVEMQVRQTLIQQLLATRDFKRSAEIQKEIEQYRAEFKDPFGLLAMSEYATMLGRETSAIDSITQYINATSGQDKAIGLYRRGSINYRRGEWEMAISDLREAKALAPSDFDYGHRILLARCLQITGQTDQAIGELNSILGESRGAMTAAMELYGVYMANKRYDEAEALVMPNYQADPKSPQWTSLLAEVAAARGDQVRAIQRAVETAQNAQFDPKAVDALLQAYLRFKRYDEMLKYVATQLPEQSRSNPLVLARVVTAYLARGDSVARTKAAEEYAKMLANVGDLGPQVLVIIREIPRWGGAQTVAEFLREQAAKHPDNALATVAASYSPLLTGDDEAFVSQATDVLAKLSTGDAASVPLRLDLLQNLATTYHKLKQFESARKAYEELLEIAPPQSGARAIALNNLAYLLVEDLQQPAAGLPYAEEAARLVPNHTNMLDTLGWSLVLSGEYDRGISAIRAALSAASAQDLVQMASVHYHAAFGLHKRSLQSRQRGQNAAADQDLSEAKLDCRRAHDLLTMARSDGDGLLAKVVALGKELGLDLKAELPEAPATQQ
ncbi:MAG TPA: tetratricopeptide repeat protein [Phycisphaerae bacterium]|nr:tetratricopeptide repeat protein [Phycisphaerae bacterium]HOM52087.1 tetratricopeptide repeat protein [Phycisphaerae bacterium]HON65525.1 tetratricopeptide repeat protein [Phycisphaerae bacterium]